MELASATTARPPPLSPEALEALAREAWPLLPVPPDERKYLLRDEAAALVDRLLVQVARGSGAISIAVGECLAALCSGDGPMRLGYSGIGDYARETLSIAGRTAYEMAKLARELRSRPLLCEAVRTGLVSVKKAEAILPVALGDSESEWVERAKRDTVRSLRAAAKGDEPAEAEKPWGRILADLDDDGREVVDRAMELAGKSLGQATPKWQRLEALCQEYLGAHPDERGEAGEGNPAPGPNLRELFPELFKSARATDLRAWLEAEDERWSHLFQAETVTAPEAGVDDLDRARRIDARLRELAVMRRRWDELLGHLCLLVLDSGLWRDMGFADPDHYASERLGMSGRAMELRAWLERRMWELPAIRQAMREGRIGYEQARLVARCGMAEYVEAWIEKAESMTVIELKRAVEADAEAQMCARKEFRLRVPEDVRALFKAACRAACAAEGRWVTPSEVLVLMASHFIETWEEALKERNTREKRVRDRDQGFCTVPGCSRPAANVHHVQYRSHGGGDEEANLVSVCLAHHLHGIHKGYVRVRGRAPDHLEWELGER